MSFWEYRPLPIAYPGVIAAADSNFYLPGEICICFDFYKQASNETYYCRNFYLYGTIWTEWN